MKIEFEFDYPMKESEFANRYEYQAYKTRCRETQLEAQLQRLKNQSGEAGRAHGEWVRVLLKLLSDACRTMP